GGVTVHRLRRGRSASRRCAAPLPGGGLAPAAPTVGPLSPAVVATRRPVLSIPSTSDPDRGNGSARRGQARGQGARSASRRRGRRTGRGDGGAGRGAGGTGRRRPGGSAADGA